MDFYATAPKTGVYSYPGLTLTSAATTISTTGTIDYAIKSKGYRKLVISSGATPTTDAQTGIAFPAIKTSKGAVIVIGLDSSGNTKATQGPITGLDTSGNFAPNAPNFGPIPDTMAPIAYVVVKAGSTASANGWVFGTNNFTGVTGVTCAVTNVMGSLPDRPQTS